MSIISPEIKVLSSLEKERLENEVYSSTFPKWKTMCLLKLLSLPVLDGVFIPPNSSKHKIKKVAEYFMSLNKVDRLLIRSDKPKEHGKYFRGGFSLGIERATYLASKLSSQGRAIVLMEPTNRFINLLSVVFLMDKKGSFVIEVLGPGFEVGDLNRGLITPQIIVNGNFINWERYENITQNNIKIINKFDNNKECITRRLKRIGNEILPLMGIEINGSAENFARKWLKKMGYDILMKDCNPMLDFSIIKNWYDDAFLVGNYLLKFYTWQNLVLSGSDLGDGRFVWWDVVDPKIKFKF